MSAGHHLLGLLQVFKNPQAAVQKQAQYQPQLCRVIRNRVVYPWRQPHGGAPGLRVEEYQILVQVELFRQQAKEGRIETRVRNDPVHCRVLDKGVAENVTE